MFDKAAFAEMDDDERDSLIEEWLKTHDPTYIPSGVVSDNVVWKEASAEHFEIFDSTTPILRPGYWHNRPAYDGDDYKRPGDRFAPPDD